MGFTNKIAYILIANYPRLPKKNANLEPNYCLDIAAFILFMLVVLNYYRYMYVSMDRLTEINIR